MELSAGMAGKLENMQKKTEGLATGLPKGKKGKKKKSSKNKEEEFEGGNIQEQSVEQSDSQY
jgi:hypothetical protein